MRFRRPGLALYLRPDDPPPGGPSSTPPTDPPTSASSPPTHWLSDPALVAHPGLQKFQDPNSLGRSYLELEKKIGQKGLVLPGPDASPQEVRAAFTALGCPEQGPEGYTMPQVQTPDGFQIDNEFVEQLRSAAWNRGIPDATWQGIYSDYLQADAARQQAYAQQVQAQQTELQEKLTQMWGTAKAEKLERAKAAALAIWGDGAAEVQFQDLGDGTPLGNNPKALEILAQLGELMEEHDLTTGLPPRVGKSADEAKTELSRLSADAEFQRALHTATDPGHADARQRWETLNRQAYPGGQTGERGVLVGRGVA